MEEERFYPADQTEWRQWLEKNHLLRSSVWLVFHTKESEKKSITWSEAVDVALCFGWIDSKKVKIDKETFHQFFSRRKPKSTWSQVNKEKVEKLIKSGLMTQAGLNSIEIAKQNCSWELLDEVEALIIPKDLENVFNKHRDGSKEYFLGLSRSVKKMILQWIVLAKRSETREKRIDELIKNLIQRKIPQQFNLKKKR